MVHTPVPSASLMRAWPVLLAVLTLGPAPQPAPLAGRWQYLQSPDSEGEVLDLSVTEGHWRGIMNGLERAGEHGLFYYVVEVERLEVEPDGAIRFEIGERRFFRDRPPLSRLQGQGDAGLARDRMRFTGRLEGDVLILRCEDKGGSCPDTVLKFQRLPAEEKQGGAVR